MSLDAVFQDMPIRRKLQAIILIISGTAVLGACAVFVGYQWITSRAGQSRQLSVMAEVVGDQCTPAVEFAQEDQATAILRALRAERQIMVAAVYASDGRLFARYVRDDVDPRHVPAHPGPDGVRFDHGDVVVSRPLLSEGARIGTFHLRSDRSNAWRRLWISLATVGVIVLGATLAVLVLSARLGRIVTGPVLRLAAVVGAVSARKDYSLRVEATSRDELGQLTDGFNDMLAQVQARDDALSRAREDLERRVALRTLELEDEIVERRVAEKAVQDLNVQLEARMAELLALNEELEAFSYSVSHDLRAPLRAIGGYSTMLIEDFGEHVDATARRYLDVITRNTEKMGQLIDDLLAFSRMNRTPMSRSPTDMTRLAQEACAEARELAAGRPITIEVAALPPAVANGPMIRQVFVNLLSNAVKYTRGRDPAVVQVGARQDAGETVYYVKDNGVGFGMAHAGKLFGIFQRLHVSEEFDGTGVGLALVHRIVQRHGGRVWAESRPDEGAVFSFTLGDGSGAAA